MRKEGWELGVDSWLFGVQKFWEDQNVSISPYLVLVEQWQDVPHIFALSRFPGQI